MSAHHRRIVNNPFANNSRRTVGYSEHRYGNSHHHNQHHRGRRAFFHSPITCLLAILLLILLSSWMPYDDQQLSKYATAEKEKTNEHQSSQTGDKPVSTLGDTALLGQQSTFHNSPDSGDGEHYDISAVENNGSVNGEHEVDYRNNLENNIIVDGSDGSNGEFNGDSEGDDANTFDNEYKREEFNEEEPIDANPTNPDDGEYRESSDETERERVVEEEETNQVSEEERMEGWKYEEEGIDHFYQEGKNNETTSNISAPSQENDMMIDKNLANITSETVSRNDTWNKPLHDSNISDGDLILEAAAIVISSSSDKSSPLGDRSIATNTTAEGLKSVLSIIDETSSSINNDLKHATTNNTVHANAPVPNISTSMDSSNTNNTSSPISEAESNIVGNIFAKDISTELLSANETKESSKITSEENSKKTEEPKSSSDTVFEETVFEKENLPETPFTNETKTDSEIANEEMSKVAEKSRPSSNNTFVVANQTAVENFMANETKEYPKVTSEESTEKSKTTFNTTSAMIDVDDIVASAINNSDTRLDTTQHSNTTTNHTDAPAIIISHNESLANTTNNSTDPFILENSTNNTKSINSTTSVKSQTTNTTTTAVTNGSESSDIGNLRGSIKD